MSSPKPQPALLARLQARDPAAQQALLAAEQPKLERLVHRILGDASSDARVVVADLFADFFFKYVDQVRTEHAIRAYLRIMAVRRAERLRRRQSLMTALESEGLEVSAAAEAAGAASLQHQQVDDELDRAPFLMWLRQCLEKLSDRARLVLKLHYGDELSYAELGQYQGCSKQAVSKVVQKSLEALRRCLEAQQQTKPAPTCRVAP